MGEILLAGLKNRPFIRNMYLEKFNLTEFLIQSEKAENWEAILTIVEQFFPYEVVAKSENFLHLVLITYDEDSKIIQKIIKQIYAKVAPYGRVKVAIIN